MARSTLSARPFAALTLLRDTAGRPPPGPALWSWAVMRQIVDLRERHGLTQAELALRCGMDQADISRIVGSTSPTARTLQRIARALDAELRLVDRAS